jgi:peroxiredoxin
MNHDVATVGTVAPPLDLPTAEGERFQLDGLRGKPVLISFLSHAA